MNLSSHFPILIVIIPLAAATLTPFIGRWRKKACSYWAILAAFISLIMCGVLIVKVYQSGPISYHLGGWAPPYGIEIFFDELSAATFVIAFLTLLILLFSIRYVEKALDPEKIPFYYTLFLLCVGGMMGFSVTGDLFNLFVFMEILSLSSYALVAISGEKIAEMASFKYLLVGAISSLCILLGIAFLYSITGSLNMNDIALRLKDTPFIRVAGMALALFLVGFGVKAAIFPLHIWLPDAHGSAPSPISALLSGLAVKIGILGILRTIPLFTRYGALNLAPTNVVLSWMAVISIVIGAFFALFQDDIKLMLAYSTISNIGYIVLGISLGSFEALTGGIVHVFNHALIKVGLFLAAGAIIHQTGYRKLSELRGVGRRMPITMGAMSIGVISIVGIPPTNGFICKWLIALGAIKAGQPIFAVALLFGALFIFAYYIKIVNAAYFREPTVELSEVKEAPTSMLGPIVILALGCLVMGFLAQFPLVFIKPAALRLLGLA